MQRQPKRAGRPNLKPNEGTEFIGVKVAETTKAKLESAADRLGISTSDVIRNALEQFIEAVEAAA